MIAPARRDWVWAGLLVLTVLAAFGQTLRAPFHFDDHALFVDSAITSSDGWLRVWRWEQTRPLTYFSFWLNFALGGTDPMGYHAVNLALHLFSCLLVADALRRLIPARAAWTGAVIFAIHPIQTEAVSYVFARSTLLAGMLTAASLTLWLRGRRWWAVAVFAAALLGKEEVAAFPVMLGLLHLSISKNREERPPIFAMLALAVAAAGRVALLTAEVSGSGAGLNAGISPVSYFLTQGAAILRYLQLAAVPVGFSVESPLGVVPVWAGVLCWATIGVLVWLSRREFGKARVGFWFMAALVLLAPTSTIFPAADLAADRRMYLPMAALGAAAGLVLYRTAYPVLLGAGWVVLAMLSFAQSSVWSGSEAGIWEDAMRWAPDRVRPRIQLARLTPPEAAIQHLQEARKLAPGDPVIASELGRVYLSMGRDSDALKEFGRVVAISPRDPLAVNNRGVALLRLGLREPALDDFRRSLALDQCLVDAYWNLKQAGENVSAPRDCRWTDEQRRRLGF